MTTTFIQSMRIHECLAVLSLQCKQDYLFFTLHFQFSTSWILQTHGLVLIHQITDSSQSDPTTEAYRKEHRLLLNMLLLSYRMNNEIVSTSRACPEADTKEKILKASNNNSGAEKERYTRLLLWAKS